HQVEEATNKAFETELGNTILSLPVVNDILANLIKAGTLCKDWYVPVHFTIHLDAFDDLIFVSLQSAVEVMQSDSRHLPCSVIKDTAGYGLTWRVKAFLLPTTYHVIALFPDHSH